LRGVEVDDEVAMETVEATQPTVAMEPVNGTEPCAHCGAPLARDQRYCLECGTPRTYLSGMMLERLRTPATETHAVHLTPAAAPPNGLVPGAGTGTISFPPAWQRGNVLTLIAGIGVLLLAMGVGVLIGRSGSSGSAGVAAPQVITVPAPTTGAAGASTTTPEATSTTPSKTSPTKAKAKQTKSSEVGSVPSKPAPPSVLKNLHTGGSGGSYEQKSKNLPNVVETG
jgi:hypothetical protein